MVGTCSSFYLFCTIIIFFPRDSYVLSDSSGNETKENTPELGANDYNNDADTEVYPFNEKYYIYRIQFKELLNGTHLNPPIPYKTPNGYNLVLEPITFTEKIDQNIFSKFSLLKYQDEIYIKVDEDLTGITDNDLMIGYKLKSINVTNQYKIGGETTVLIRVLQSLPASDTVLKFEEPRYSIKLSYGHKGKVFNFKALKTAPKVVENDLEFEKQHTICNYQSKKEYSFEGNYSLEFVPDKLLSKLKINKNGDLEIIGNIDEGFYDFDIVAVDFGPKSSTVLRAKSKVHLFVDNVAVCSSNASKFIKAFSKHYINEETKLQTAIPATGNDQDCNFAISHQYPFGEGADFFVIDPKSGAINVKNAIDREAYWFEEMDEPSVYLRLKIHCPPLEHPDPIKPLNMLEIYPIPYDPNSTLVQLVIMDINDNPPVFPDEHVIIGYPVQDIADTIIPKHLIQVKATDKDTGKHGKIQYLLKGENAKDFVVNPETGTVYCIHPVDKHNDNRVFEVVAKDNEGNFDGFQTTMSVTVMPLTYSEIIRVNVMFIMVEDYTAIELQLSEISGVKVISLTNDVINRFVDGRWRTERTLTVYGINNSDGSLVSGSDLKKKLVDNSKILEISEYPTKSETNTVMYAALVCLIVSMVAMGLLYFGYVKNGLYILSCISSSSTTLLKDDMENMSQSNWITTFNRSSISSARVQFLGTVDSPMPSPKVVDHTCVVVENNLYEDIPRKKDASTDNPSRVKLDSNFSFEDDLIKLEKMDETFLPNDHTSFNY